ncbi:MAG: methyltransferase domain-containing protein [Planctomycetes bacterium]|nr:methyltransferase domain-containing protein [Planctomycetota bacterium]
MKDFVADNVESGSLDRSVKGRMERWLIRRLLKAAGNPPIAIVLPNGAAIGPEDTTPVARIMLRDRGAMLKLLYDPTYQFCELYSHGRLDVDGDLTELLCAISRAIGSTDWSRLGKKRIAAIRHWLSRNSLAGSRRHIHHHYDIGNDFYKLWLDERMLYTCAYYAHPGMSVEAAQIAKMDHVCRKLQLHPGDEVIEAGCGWGGLAMHMAEHYGVKVRALNISREQVRFAREKAEKRGLSDRVTFVEDDWRNIEGRCDAFVSVGMLEHVGIDNYRQLGEVIDGCLKPNGRGLIHTIGRNYAAPLDAWITKRIFPGACPPSLKQMMSIFEPRDFSVLDVENLRLHYARTLRHWHERYEQHVETVRGMYDETFVRMWRLYLCGSIAAFAVGDLQLFQVVFARGRDNHVPMTREHLYKPSGK